MSTAGHVGDDQTRFRVELRRLSQERSRDIDRYHDTMTQLEQAAASAVEAGIPVTEVAELLDVSRPAVYKMLEAAGAPRPARAAPPRIVEAEESKSLARLTDEPIKNRTDDRLGRDGLARVIAREIKRAPRAGGFTMAVTGPWGSGKTSVVNLVLEQLKVAKDVEIVHFNPWFFSGAHDLLARFFDEVAGQLEGRPHRKLREVAERLKVYGAVLTPLMRGLPAAGGVLAGVSESAAIAATQGTSLRSQRQSVASQLSQMDARLLVVIDDIDRLSPEEVRDIVKLVRLVGDFPNVVYLLSFDPSRVELVLGEGNDVAGREYLEKIVQLNYSLPAISRSKMREVALEDLEAALRGRDLELFDERAWGNLFALGVEPMLRHLRDVRRFANAAPAAIDLLGDEVAAQDLLALTALRVFEPRVHEKLHIIAALEHGAGGSRLFSDDPEHRALADQVEALLEPARNKEAVRQLLRQLFPQIGDLLGGTREVGSGRAWRRARRVADAEVLNIYLTAARDEEQVSTIELQRFVGALGDEDALRTLLGQVPDALLTTVLDRLRDYEDAFQAEDAEASATVFLGLMERLRPESGMFSMPPEWALHFVMEAALRPVASREDRDAIIRRLFDDAGTLSQRMRLLNWFGTFPEAKDRRTEGDLLSAHATAELKTELRGQVIQADPSSLAAERDLLRLLLLLREPEDERSRRISAWAAEPVFLLALIKSCFGYQDSLTVGDVVPRRSARLDWDTLQQLLGEGEIWPRLLASRPMLDSLATDEEAGEALQLAYRYASGEERPSSD
jgi:predicted KAP-like P-loop ATPase